MTPELAHEVFAPLCLMMAIFASICLVIFILILIFDVGIFDPYPYHKLPDPPPCPPIPEIYDNTNQQRNEPRNRTHSNRSLLARGHAPENKLEPGPDIPSQND